MAGQVGNWTEERCATQGTGPLVLGGTITPDKVSFALSLQAGTVEYSILNGNDRETGLGTFDGTTGLIRTTVYSTLINEAYLSDSPPPLNLVGASVVSCTFNTTAFNEFNSNSGGGSVNVVDNLDSAGDVTSALSANQGYVIDQRLTPAEVQIGLRETAATGIVSGGSGLKENDTQISVNAGTGEIVNGYNDRRNPTVINIAWNAISFLTIDMPDSLGVQVIYADFNGTVLQKANPLSNAERRQLVQIAFVYYKDGVVQNVQPAGIHSNEVGNTLYDWMYYTPLTNRVKGMGVRAVTGALSVYGDAGTLISPGINIDNSQVNPHIGTFAAVGDINNEVSFDVIFADGSDYLANQTVMPYFYESAPGVATAITGNDGTIHYLFRTFANTFVLQLGSTLYTSGSRARDSLAVDRDSYVLFTGNTVTLPSAQIYIGNSATDFSDSNQAGIASLIGAGAGASGSVSVTDWLSLSDTVPTTYAGAALSIPQVNAGETGLEFFDINAALSGKENNLLNPTVDGQVLTSTIGGVRSWATQSVGVTDHALLSNIGTNTHAQIDTHITDTTTNLDLKYDKTGGPLTGNLTIDVAAPILKLKSSFSGDGNNWDSFVDINNGNYILKSRNGVNATVFDYAFSPAGSMTANRVFATNEVPLVGSELTTKNYVEGVLVTNTDSQLTSKAVTDFDAISASGFYKAVNATGTPIAGEIQLIDLHWDAAGKSQIAMSNDTGNVYTRVPLGGIQQPWKQLTDTDYVTSTTLDLAGTRSMTGDLTLNSPSPAIYLQNLNAPAGSQGWGTDSSSGGDFRIVTTSDTGTFETAPFTLSRTGFASIKVVAPVSADDAINLSYLQDNYLNLAGGTMTGDLRLTPADGFPTIRTIGASIHTWAMQDTAPRDRFRLTLNAATGDSAIERLSAAGALECRLSLGQNGAVSTSGSAVNSFDLISKGDSEAYTNSGNRIVTTEFSGGIYNLVVTDEGNSTKSTATTSQTFNFVADIGMPIGAQGIIVRGNNGPLFMQAGAGITLISKGGLFNVDAQEGVVTWYHESSNVYRIMGDLA